MSGYDVLSGIITIALGIWLFYGPWQSYVIDQTRQQLYECRDRLFDLGVKHPQYRETKEYDNARNMLNAATRFAHELNLATFFFVLIVPKNQWRGEIKDRVKTIPSLEDKRLEHEIGVVMDEAFATISLCFLRRSIALILLLPLIILAVFILQGSYGLYRASRRVWFDRLGPLILSEGTIR